MKFRYAKYEVTPSESNLDRNFVYRPVIPVRFLGPKAARDVYALLDTGADESYITENMAHRLGVTPLSDRVSTIQSASGEMPAWYGRMTIEVADGSETLSFSTTVGVVGEDWSEAILGHLGFLEYFEATFLYGEYVTLTPCVKLT